MFLTIGLIRITIIPPFTREELMEAINGDSDLNTKLRKKWDMNCYNYGKIQKHQPRIIQMESNQPILI
jgi:hypothetical protein